MATTIIGKTYTLRDEADSSDAFYARIGTLVDECAALFGGEKRLLDFVSTVGRRRRAAERLAASRCGSSREAEVMLRACRVLQEYTTAVDAHLASLPLSSRFNRTMSMSRNQYHLAILEIELTNRLNRDAFLASAHRIAMLPHCLHDLERACLSRPDEFEQQCRGCSKSCRVNAVSRMLRAARIEPYIWREANLKTMLRTLAARHGSVGVLGVACIPELVAGLRRCRRHGVPAVGIPLDANRCARWYGEFRENGVNIAKIRQLIIDD